MTGMYPSEVIEPKKVPLLESYPPEDTLLEDGLYPYLLQPGKEHNNQHERAMDRLWSKTIYRLREVEEDSGNWVMCYISDGPKRAFISEELMLIPKDTELPPDYFQNGNIYPSWIDIANGDHELFKSFWSYCSDVLLVS